MMSHGAKRFSPSWVRRAARSRRSRRSREGWFQNCTWRQHETTPTHPQSSVQQRTQRRASPQSYASWELPLAEPQKITIGRQKIPSSTRNRSVHCRLLLSGMSRHCRTRWRGTLRLVGSGKRRSTHPVSLSVRDQGSQVWKQGGVWQFGRCSGNYPIGSSGQCL